MGDCAIIIFYSPKEHAVSPAVYLHYHGACVLALLETAMPMMRTEDAGYSCARFIGRCHSHIPGITGLGVFNLPGAPAVAKRSTDELTKEYEQLLSGARKFNWGDRGIFLVNVDVWKVEHAGSVKGAYGDYGDGFVGQEETDLNSVDGVVQLPANLAKIN